MTVESTRVSRAEETRAEMWKPPSTLDTPPAPEGYKYRWVRASLVGTDETVNIMNRERQHYTVVRPEEVKGWKSPTSNHGKHGACIMVGDLILMKVPLSVVEQRNKYFEDRARAAQRAVDENLMKHNSELMPITKRNNSNVTVGRAPSFEDDD